MKFLGWQPRAAERRGGGRHAACENDEVEGTVPVVANGGIGDTTGTVPFARKAMHSTPFAAVAALKLC